MLAVEEALVQAAPRERIVAAALQLLTNGGLEAVSTRAVSAAAGVQVPTIYRHFGDMRELLDEVTSRGFAVYLRSKSERTRPRDPVDDLRGGWELHVDFGLTNPSLYGLMFGPRAGGPPSAATESGAVLRALVQRVAEAGRLKVGVEQAAQMVHAASMGVVFELLATPREARDLGLAISVREALLAAITTDQPAAEFAEARVQTRAVALKAVLPEAALLTAGERGLLEEWLDRLSASTSL